MIITYNLTTFAVTAALPGNDAAAIAFYTTNLPTGHQIYTPADNAGLLANPSLYFILESAPGTPSGYQLKYYLDVTSTATIDLSDTPVVYVQLKQSDHMTNYNAIKTIAVKGYGGTLSAPTLTTTASGAATGIFSPVRGCDVATLSLTCPQFENQMYAYTINVPTTPADQNWIQAADIKPAAITADKLSADVKLTPLLSAGIVLNVAGGYCNSVVADATYVYANAFDGIGAANPMIYKVNKVTGATVATRAYVNNNLTSGNDGMALDGTTLWVASGGDIIEINATTMAINNTFTIDAAGSLEFVVLDPDTLHIWSFVWGGAAYPYQVVKILKATGAIVLNVDPKGGFGANVHQKQAAIISDQIFVNHSHIAGGIWGSSIDLATGAVTLSGMTVSPSESNGLGSDGSAIYQPNGFGMETDLDPLGASLPGSTLASAEIGVPHAMTYDSANMWVITSAVGETTPSQVREIIRVMNTIYLGRSLDVTTNPYAGPNLPNNLSTYGSYVYIANMQPSATSAYNITAVKFQ